MLSLSPLSPSFAADALPESPLAVQDSLRTRLLRGRHRCGTPEAALSPKPETLNPKR